MNMLCIDRSQTDRYLIWFAVPGGVEAELSLALHPRSADLIGIKIWLSWQFNHNLHCTSGTVRQSASWSQICFELLALILVHFRGICVIGIVIWITKCI